MQLVPSCVYVGAPTLTCPVISSGPSKVCVNISRCHFSGTISAKKRCAQYRERDMNVKVRPCRERIHSSLKKRKTFKIAEKIVETPILDITVERNMNDRIALPRQRLPRMFLGRATVLVGGDTRLGADFPALHKVLSANGKDRVRLHKHGQRESMRDERNAPRSRPHRIATHAE